jgi:hypothetical protein
MHISSAFPVDAQSVAAPVSQTTERTGSCMCGACRLRMPYMPRSGAAETSRYMIA